MEANAEIWDALRAGNVNALEKLFRKYFDGLLSYAIRLSQNELIGEEAVQEVFLKLWETHKRLPKVGSVSAFLYRAVRNQTIDELRNQQKKSAKFVEISNGILVHSFSIEEDLIARETEMYRRQQLQKEISLLNPLQQEILFLRFYNQLSYQEIAEILDIKYQTVRNYMSQSLGRLKKKIKK